MAKSKLDKLVAEAAARTEPAFVAPAFKVRKPDDRRWPGLKEYWEAYGHSKSWSDMVDWKERGDGLYVMLAWDHGDGTFGFADIAGTRDGDWQMQNDSEECTIEEWKKIKVDPHCDGFHYPKES